METFEGIKIVKQIENAIVVVSANAIGFPSAKTFELKPGMNLTNVRRLASGTYVFNIVGKKGEWMLGAGSWIAPLEKGVLDKIFNTIDLQKEIDVLLDKKIKILNSIKRCEGKFKL